jgi:hypothetical protein
MKTVSGTSHDGAKYALNVLKTSTKDGQSKIIRFFNQLQSVVLINLKLGYIELNLLFLLITTICTLSGCCRMEIV